MSHVLKFLSPVMIYVHLQVVAILCIGYLGSLIFLFYYEYKTTQDCKCAWKFGNFHIRD